MVEVSECIADVCIAFMPVIPSSERRPRNNPIEIKSNESARQNIILKLVGIKSGGKVPSTFDLNGLHNEIRQYVAKIFLQVI
jgi:hypothetical protein